MQRAAIAVYSAFAAIAVSLAAPASAYDPDRLIYADKMDARSLTEYGSRLVEDELATAAIPFLQTAIEEDPGYADAYVWLGLAYAAEGRFDKATDCYQRYLVISPDGDRRAELEKALAKSGHRPSRPKQVKSVAKN
jgi:tetratricopeptide (TPR) repeat protein